MFKKLVEKAKKLVLFVLFVQANSLTTGRFITGCKNSLMPNICRWKLPKPYDAIAPYEEHIKCKEMAEEALKKRFKDSLDGSDNNVSHVCGDTVCRLVKESFRLVRDFSRTV